jgi:hypothetical protein
VFDRSAMLRMNAVLDVPAGRRRHVARRAFGTRDPSLANYHERCMPR